MVQACEKKRGNRKHQGSCEKRGNPSRGSPSLKRKDRPTVGNNLSLRFWVERN